MTIESIIKAKAKDIGGFAVRRALPAIERRMIGPFIFLDQIGPAVIPASGSAERVARGDPFSCAASVFISQLAPQLRAC